MFLQDDYLAAEESAAQTDSLDYGLGEEPSCTSFVIYEMPQLRVVYDKKTAWTDYLSRLATKAFYVSPYTGEPDLLELMGRYDQKTATARILADGNLDGRRDAGHRTDVHRRHVPDGHLLRDAVHRADDRGGGGRGGVRQGADLTASIPIDADLKTNGFVAYEDLATLPAEESLYPSIRGGDREAVLLGGDLPAGGGRNDVPTSTPTDRGDWSSVRCSSAGRPAAIPLTGSARAARAGRSLGLRPAVAPCVSTLSRTATPATTEEIVDQGRRHRRRDRRADVRQRGLDSRGRRDGPDLSRAGAVRRLSRTRSRWIAPGQAAT